jgi:two-component system, LytTR family, sensor histidine kinase AlgZ
MHPLLSSRPRLGAYLLGWVPIAAMMVGVGASQGWPLKEAAALAFPLTLAGAFMFMSTWYLCRALPVASFRWRSHGIAWFLTAVVLGNLWYQCGFFIAKLWALHPGFVGLPARVRAGWGFFLPMGALLALAALALHYLLDAWERAQDSERRENELRVLAREAELKALRAQLNPHFLFNSLNSISALTTVDPKRAREMCVLLSDFLRKSLKLGERTSVSLGEEMDLLRSYLAIERVRFGDRLQVRWEILEEGSAPLPPLLLQPLVENAIKHGIASLPEGGTLLIRSEREGPRVAITLENPADTDVEPPQGLGMGLRQVKERLLGRFGSRAAFGAEAPPGIFRVRLLIPITEEDP